MLLTVVLLPALRFLLTLPLPGIGTPRRNGDRWIKKISLKESPRWILKTKNKTKNLLRYDPIWIALIIKAKRFIKNFFFSLCFQFTWSLWMMWPWPWCMSMRWRGSIISTDMLSVLIQVFHPLILVLIKLLAYFFFIKDTSVITFNNLCNRLFRLC